MKDNKFHGYYISPITKSIHKHNPISGHRWTEYKEMKGFRISGPHSWEAPERFKTIEAAKAWILEDIAFYNKFPLEDSKNETPIL